MRWREAVGGVEEGVWLAPSGAAAGAVLWCSAHRFARQKAQQLPCYACPSQPGSTGGPLRAFRNPGEQGWKLLLHTLLRLLRIGGTIRIANGGRSLPSQWRVSRVLRTPQVIRLKALQRRRTARVWALSAQPYPQPASPPRYTHEHAKFSPGLPSSSSQASRAGAPSPNAAPLPPSSQGIAAAAPG